MTWLLPTSQPKQTLYCILYTLYCIMFRLEFYTAFSQLFKPDLNQQPKSAKYLIVFFFWLHYTSPELSIVEKEREREARGFYSLQVQRIQLIQFQTFLLFNCLGRKLIKQINKNLTMALSEGSWTWLFCKDHVMVFNEYQTHQHILLR